MEEMKEVDMGNWLTEKRVDDALSTTFVSLLESFQHISRDIRSSLWEDSQGFVLDNGKRIPLESRAMTHTKAILSRTGLVASLSCKHDGMHLPSMLGGHDFSVSLSPLTSSSMHPGSISGSIFGVWLGRSLTHRSAREMVVSGVVVYGQQIQLHVGMVGIPGVHKFIYRESPITEISGRWIWQENVDALDALDAGVLWEVGHPEAKASNKGLNEFVEYNGAREPPRVERALAVAVEGVLNMKGGTLVCGESPQFPSDISVVHEALPVAYLLEKAGGKSSNGLTSLIDMQTPKDTQETTQAVWGTFEAGESFKRFVGPPPTQLTKKIDLNALNITSNEDTKGIELILSNPRGFCEGVKRAIDTVEEALRIWGAPIYVKHEIVHNEVVVENLKAKGAIFVEELKNVPPKSIIVYSAHGIPPHVRQQAKERELFEVDATCPLVTKVHVYVKKKADEGYNIILIGHKNHVEVIGTAGEAPESVTVVESVKDVKELEFSQEDKLFYATQTTLSLDDCAEIVEALKLRYPKIESIPSGSVCYATTNRQMALRQVAPSADVTFVVGSQLSSNAARLVETSERRGTKSYLVNHPNDVKPEMLIGAERIALTSSASTPEETVNEVMKRLQLLGVSVIREDEGVPERLPNWKLPRNLKQAVLDHAAAAKVSNTQ
ncbi:4-hydroxy-3-methylbut-2-enyl diphosphate reductase [Cardiosporidium cionae]|uniref:4-hydroxy-3-methylbut-2-enyl diphosphate reductase n=1 Tax=Cardiosporidium cionae TaxID=476202 RepID=A0ABQ7J923_9APIC|nr:4-hydroxy-3-methylbut-2-enyl diphosphate reductase [Cardiosporidium cionae]|eukprot:KAF8820482.1 4-hydroxy-3-methylbut-2-enyl diphosphate reductase [Cardiosporidium cionae]